MFQLCNEIPTEDLDDRNPENLGIGREDGLYPRYLTEKYGQASRLNQYYESDFSDLLTIEPHMLEAANPSFSTAGSFWSLSRTFIFRLTSRPCGKSRGTMAFR